MSVYDTKPERFLERLVFQNSKNPSGSVCCAGFAMEAWRCEPFANHLIEWLPEYALPEEELSISHGNMYVKMQQAAVRVYTSEKYKKRGEAGEISIHAICREFFGTIPISPRVFYKSASNDPVKSFDMVHARLAKSGVELWLGESKLYTDSTSAVTEAIRSVKLHLDQGFLTNQKLLLGPQIPKSAPRYEEIIELFKVQTSLDKFLTSAVFVIGILCNSKAAKASKAITEPYKAEVARELKDISDKIAASGLTSKLRILVLYVPLADKASLVKEFDRKLKGLR